MFDLPSYLPPLLSSVSMGCFSAVMSRNVNRNSTTKSRSFRMGATCNNSHNGVSVMIPRNWESSGSNISQIMNDSVIKPNKIRKHCVKSHEKAKQQKVN